MPPFTILTSRTVVLPASNIDTDQIIPARFLTTTTREGLGAHLFADWRYDEGGAPRPDFVLNRPASAGCRILVAGRNFGCGSSREHAPWALLDPGHGRQPGLRFLARARRVGALRLRGSCGHLQRICRHLPQ